MNFDYPLFCGKRMATLKDFRKCIAKLKEKQACSVGFWKRKFDYDITPEVWSLAYKATKETRLRLLHWKIVHNIYPTNIMLSKMKVKETNKCSECVDIVDVIEHFFFECPKVLRFWKYIETFCLTHLDKQIKIDVEVALFGCFAKDYNEYTLSIVNHIVLIAKMSISIAKKTNSSLSLNDIFEEKIRYRLKYTPFQSLLYTIL